MIPKVIHYCWFGGNPLPKLAQKCIKSWKKYCPAYTIICWNESNYDISAAPLYVRQAYEAKKWAFVTDYVRLQVVYDHGGIYLDTDVELIKPLDSLLDHKAYFGFEDHEHINTGLGFGAEKGAQILADMMKDYESIPFVLADGSLDMIACPERNTTVFVRQGLVQNGQYQEVSGFAVYPKDVFCPKDFYTGILRITRNTYSIHQYDSSWFNEQRQEVKRKRWRTKRIEAIIYTIRYAPNRIAMKVLGQQNYEALKQRIKNKG